MVVFAGDPVLASDINGLALRVAETVLVADTSTWSNTEFAIATVTAALVAGKRYKIGLTGRESTDVAADSDNMRIREDSLSGTQLQLAQIYLPVASGNGYQTSFYAEYTAVSTGNKTFQLTGQRSAGTGTAHRIRAGGSSPGLLFVDRITV